MDTEVILSLIGIVVLILVIVATFGGYIGVPSKNPTVKKDEIINGYREQLQAALEPLMEDDRARLDTKKSLLKKFSDELSRNIFFDNGEIREIILDLSKNS